MAATLGITIGTAHAQSGSKPATQSSESKKADEGSGAKVDSRAVVHPRAEAAKPVKVGEQAPAVKGLRNAKGEAVDLAAVTNGKTTLLVFYRGGWCPYCNTHLAELAQLQPELAANGVQVVAISPDSPETLAAYPEDKKQPYSLLSDSLFEAAKAYGVAFAIDGETQEKLKGYGIDLAKASGNTTAVLPVPAVFVIGPDGLVKFSHTNADYTKRLSGSQVLKGLGIEQQPGSEPKSSDEGGGSK
jgi:peroxiredoxin